MNKILPAIVIIAFNRPKSLARLLKSVAVADFANKKSIHLIISIDKGDNNQDVLQIAQQFDWGFGEKKIFYQNENLGLRRHVVKCASLSEQYGSIILLEDDLLVSPQFYNFALQALEFSLNKDYIGGISLYNHQFNVNAKSNFSPIEDGFDNWYLQFASSWGQAWTNTQWNSFIKWYNNQDENLIPCKNIPSNVTRWSSKSWLKYFIYYLVEENKFFLYPKMSLTTNFSETGTHINQDSTIYQVPLSYAQNTIYNFSDLIQSKSCYDVFFENCKLSHSLGIKQENLCIDLYGTKSMEQSKKQYLLSSRVYDFKIVKSFARQLKPRDANIISDIPGNEFFLYKTSVRVKNPNKTNFYNSILYDIKHITRRDSKKLFLLMYSKRLILFIKKCLNIS